MPNDSPNYKLRILYEVNVAKWRIDDQRLPDNREWCIYVFDRNREIWVPVSQLGGPGEGATIKHIQIADE
jgi:hypothetical protein